MSEENKVIETNDETITLYEIGIHLIPTLEEKTQEVFDSMKKILEKNGATITESSNPVLIPLAYTIVKNVESKNFKYDTASFGWIKFNLNTELVEKLKEELALQSDILRYVILKTEAESTTQPEEILHILDPSSDEEDVDESEEKAENTEESKEEDVEKEETKELEESKEEVSEEIEEAIDSLVEEIPEEDSK